MLPHPNDSVVRLFARGGDSRDGDFARTSREVATFAKAYPEHNIYVAPNPTGATGGSRHTAAQVTHWSFFLIDIDPVCSCPKKGKKTCVTCRGKADPEAALEQALIYIGEWCGRDFTKNRPLIIDSGRGYQAWIRLADISLDDTVRQGEIISRSSEDVVHRTTARRINSYWLARLDKQLGVSHGCKIDTSVSDLPRLMRCPGTVNVKTGRKATLVHVTDRVFHGFAQLLAIVPKEKLTDPVSTFVPESGQSWQDVYPHLTRMSQMYLTQGQEEPGRHKVMWHTAKKLQELGVDRKNAWKALKWANKLKGEDEELPADQIKHALDTAYGPKTT